MGEFLNGMERRRSNRVAAQKGAFAFNGTKYGRIIDVSVEGLCFQYITRRKGGAERNFHQCKAVASMDIVVGAYNFSLVNLPVKVVADYGVSTLQDGESMVNVRRRAVTFEGLSPQQHFLLKRFLLLNLYGDGAPYEFKAKRKESKWVLYYSEQK